MAILFDLDGVFYQGDQALPGGRDAVDWANQAGIPYLFLTNTTSKPRQALVDKLSGLGIETDTDHILTPAVVAAKWCERHLPGKPVALFVPDATAVEFSALPRVERNEEVAAVIVGDLGEAWDFASLNTAFRLLMTPQRPKLIALGPPGGSSIVVPLVVVFVALSGLLQGLAQ